MTTSGLLPPSDYDRDSGHLSTLSIFWYIISLIQILAGCVMLGYLVLVVMMGMGIASSGHQQDAQAGAAFSGIFGCFGVVLLVLLWGVAFLNFMVARSLPRRRHRTLCFVMAAITCFFLPLGTILGIFTLMVLSRPSVRAASV